MSRMHVDELEIDEALVRRLLAEQFSDWASLPIERVGLSGTVNALYRLGDDMLVRLPRMAWGMDAVERELRWLPKLVPLLPVATPVPLAIGAPIEGYHWKWGVYPWLDGENPNVDEIADPHSLAKDMARFVRALHAVDLRGAPHVGRGGAPLAEFDESTRSALVALEGVIDTDAAAAAWDESLETPEWPGSRVWTHGDLMPGNLLVRGDALVGVIDWGGFGLGDPACDLMVAWNLLSADARAIFRAELDVDDETWLRGRGWALWTGLVALPYYTETNPVLADNARYRIQEVLADDHGARDSVEPI